MILDFTGVCPVTGYVRTISIEYVPCRTNEVCSYAKGKPSCACATGDTVGKSNCASTCTLYQSAPSDIR